MRIILTLLQLFCLNLSFGQQNQSEYQLRWKAKDTINYNVAFGEINIKANNKSIDIQDTLAQKVIKHIRKEMGVDLNDYKLSSTINPKENNFDVFFYFNNYRLLSGKINNSGKLLTQVEKKSENFFKILFELPNHKIKVGDEWRSNIQFQKKFKGFNIYDSSRTDKVILEKVYIESGKEIAQIEYEVSEIFNGQVKDTFGNNVKAFFKMYYNSTGYFNITDGEWNSIDGIMIFDIDAIKKKRLLTKVGMIKK